MLRSGLGVKRDCVVWRAWIGGGWPGCRRVRLVRQKFMTEVVTGKYFLYSFQMHRIMVVSVLKGWEFIWLENVVGFKIEM